MRHESIMVGLMAAISIFALPARAPAQAPGQAPVTAFVDVSVIPMDRERSLTHQTVVVRGDRIAAMGSVTRVRVPDEAVRVDGRGKFLIPGLADMHAHAPGWSGTLRAIERGGVDDAGLAEAQRRLFLYAANGVTTVRLLFGWPQTLLLRDRAANGELLSPRIYAAAGPVDMRGPAPTPDSAVRFVKAAKAAGYDFVKLHGMGGEAWDSAMAAARRMGIPVVGHTPSDSNGLERAIRAGYASIEHLTGFDQYLSWGRNGSTQSVADAAKLRVIAAVLQQAGVWNCPTLVNEARNEGFLFLVSDTAIAWPEWRYLTDTLRAQWLYSASDDLARWVADTARRTVAWATFRAYGKVIKALQDRGVGLLLGTDAGGPYLVPGFSIHRELQALVQAGLTPYQALATGTRNAAAFLGTLDSTGTVAVGKRADLVLLTGNPLNDIRYTAQPAGVMLAGRWLSRAELNARLKALEGALN